MSAFVFIRKSTWRLLKKQSNSEQTLLHRLIELFFTDTGGIKIVFLLTYSIQFQVNPTFGRAPGIQAWRCREQPLLNLEMVIFNKQAFTKVILR